MAGQPELPDWVYNGAILGVQGGTDTMLNYLDESEAQGVRVSAMWIQELYPYVKITFRYRSEIKG